MNVDINIGGEPYSFPVDINPQPIAPNSRILIRGGRGTITVRSSDEPTLRITGQKQIRTFSEADAQKRSASIDIQAVKVGDGYEIHPGRLRSRRFANFRGYGHRGAEKIHGDRS